MRRIDGWCPPVFLGTLLALLAAPASASAQLEARFRAGDVTDTRLMGGPGEGGLSVRVSVLGDDLEGVAALRFFVTEARDDLGNTLLPEAMREPEFNETRGGRPEGVLRLRNPAREAATFLVRGRVELFLPGSDPKAVVTVPDALARPGKTLASPGLKAAGVEVALLPRTGLPREVLALRGRKADFDRIRSIRILQGDGTEVEIAATGRLSDGETTQMSLEASEPIPKGISLVFTILTAQAIVAVPFELAEVPLP